MTTYYLNGNPLVEGADIVINGFTYPYTWLEGTSPSVRASLGIEKLGDVNYNPKYYWGVDNPKHLEDREETDEEGNAVYVKVWDPTVGEFGEMVDTEERLVSKGLKTTCAQEIKLTTNQLLSSTDFYILRNEVESLQIPESISTYRTEVIEESTRLQEAILAATTVEELIAVMNSTSWPEIK